MFGKEHRKIMHDSRTVVWIEMNYGPVPALVAKGHIALDIAVSSAKRRGELK
ncbi:MAG: hypothetical protein PHH85_02065 [Candidatus Methanoperedens sp.]|nr:hypothetical protein [Candidatus Methanoperedens sp.]